MKQKIYQKLLDAGIDDSIFVVHETKKETSKNRYVSSFYGVSKSVKYYILYVESINIVLVWQSKDSFLHCTISRKKVLKALENEQDFVYMDKEYPTCGRRIVCLSDVQNIGNLIKKLESL